MGILNKSGFPSERNLSKPFRPQRTLKDGTIHPLDNMKCGGGDEVDRRKNTTGCFGIKSSFGIRVHIPGPKKGRRTERRKKNTCRLMCSQDVLRLPKEYDKHIIQTKIDILSLKEFGEIYNVEFITKNEMIGLAQLNHNIYGSGNYEDINQYIEEQVDRKVKFFCDKGLSIREIQSIIKSIRHTITSYRK